ncbi:hypothetical protein GBAR_LOCUS6571 [Geodia barretti]|uniref:Uncharacterized protein n=1 Tax=Geodia barretti TaxID=519541 RepID=A0AA35RF91_GEOBA|nr:hypothetical protein GBAR_LOCUS6571 [Geodia barretti]
MMCHFGRKISQERKRNPSSSHGMLRLPKCYGLNRR